MSVAVKNTPETSATSLYDRIPIMSLAGLVYLLGSLAIVFMAIPYVWGQLWGSAFGNTNSFASATLMGVVMLAAFAGLVALGGHLLGPKAPPGVRAGIFTALVGLLLVVGVTRWFSLWVEYYCYHDYLFGTNGSTVGAIVTAIVGGTMLVLFLRWFFRPNTERLLAGFEEQGWFSTTTFKKNQGMRVRRGTILGLLILFGSGVFTLVSHKTLERGPANWDVNIPFTGKVTITPETVGDAGPLLAAKYPGWAAAGEKKPLTIDRFALRDINSQLDPKEYVKIDNVANLPFPYKDGEIVRKSDYEAAKKKQEAEGESVPGTVAPTPASGPMTYASIRLLPEVRYSLPFLLLGLTVWFAWRVVNLPVFADFLIATEAELNKVSWTTRKRLYQDTIVVLTTVILMAVYLFAMDQLWAHLLSWRPIGVIVYKQDQSGAKGADQKPW